MSNYGKQIFDKQYSEVAGRSQDKYQYDQQKKLIIL